MHRLAVMGPYIEKHLQELREKIQDEALIMKQHKIHHIMVEGTKPFGW
jgi:hypothetical protein